MVWYDIVVLTILVITTWRGAQRGLVTQLAWIAAVVLCFKFADALAPSITPHIAVGEPNDRVRHWIAMFILFVGFSVASFLVARTIESSLHKAKLKELDRFLGAALGFVFGAVIVMVGTFFTSVLPPTKAAVLQSRTGLYACEILDAIQPLTPEHFHQYLVEYRKRIPHDGQDHLGDGTSLSGFFEGEDGLMGDLDGQGDGFDLSDLGNGLADQFSSGGSGSSGSTGAASGPTLDQLWRSLPDNLRIDHGDEIMRHWNSATPNQRQHLVDELTRAFDTQAPSVLRDFFTSTTQPAGSSANTAQSNAARMLNEIGDIYQDRELIVRRTQEHLAGVPSNVKVGVIEDWYADLNMRPDPDPYTNVQSRLDVRILRQLERARVPLTDLSFELRQRLNRSRQ